MRRTGATTNNKAFGRGMIFEVRYSKTTPVPPLSSGDEISIRLPDGSEIILEVAAVDEGQTIVRTPKLGEWRLEQLPPNELPKRINNGDRASYWQVDDQISP